MDQLESDGVLAGWISETFWIFFLSFLFSVLIFFKNRNLCIRLVNFELEFVNFIFVIVLYLIQSILHMSLMN